ncbi:MAG TPA: homoserine kinase, partial [Bdellovibrionota bacterium]|nr:homoserine kinase [Bdellovibrionota bacterium]
ATVSNVAVGFDLLGFSIEGIGDRATVTKTQSKGQVEIEAIEGLEGLPTDARANTASAGLIELLKERKLPFGFRIRIEKGIPLGSGMGGSAASAVAAAVAANALLESPLGHEELLEYILIGEAVASGSKHGDNVTPCLVGGLVMVTSVEPPRFVRIPAPGRLWAAVVHPPLEVKTKAARAILKPEIPLKTHVAQAAKLGGFLAGCFTDDISLVAGNLVDLVIEPQRAQLIRGFSEVKQCALSAGALGCSISGAGPAVFALTDGKDRALAVAEAMKAAFAQASVPGARSWVSSLSNPGARLVKS